MRSNSLGFFVGLFLWGILNQAVCADSSYVPPGADSNVSNLDLHGPTTTYGTDSTATQPEGLRIDRTNSTYSTQPAASKQELFPSENPLKSTATTKISSDKDKSKGGTSVLGLTDKTAKTGVGMTDRAAKTGVGLTDKGVKGVGKATKEVFKMVF